MARSRPKGTRGDRAPDRLVPARRIVRAQAYHEARGDIMDNPHSPSPLRESDYEAIEAAVMETEKGRWFLAEYARRNRSADTDVVLAAVGRLEKLLHRERRPDLDRIRLDVAEMKDAIDRTKTEIAQLKHDVDVSRVDRATHELDSIVTQTESATSEILGAAEKLQEVAWTMREGGIEPEICDTVETLVMTIYTACSFQDLTGQRTQKVVHVLRYLEARINAMIEIWGLEASEVAAQSGATPAPAAPDARPDAHLLNGPALAGEGVDQTGVDDLMGAAFEPAALALPAPSDPAGDEDAGLAAADAVPVDDMNGDGDAAAVDPFAALDAVAGPGLEVEVPAGAFEDTEPAGVPVHAPAAIDEAALADLEGAAALAAANAAMETALETLREVSGTVARPAARAPDERGPDPLDELDRAERLALFG